MDKKKRRIAQAIVILVIGAMVLTTVLWAVQLSV